MQRTVLLAGANGLVGKALLSDLLNDPRVKKVYSLVRRQTGITADKLEERVVNFDRLKDVELPEIDDVYCALGTTMKVAGTEEAFRRVDFTYPIELGKRGKELGAKRYILVSSIGASAKSKVFYSRVKGETEDAIAGLGFESVFFFRPSLLVGERAEGRTGESVGKVVSTLLQPFLKGSLKRYRAIESTTVARAMVRAAASTRTGTVVLESDEIERLGTEAP